jgi:DNA helicase-2/ATP-dependent DNA helicase PcrA
MLVDSAEQEAVQIVQAVDQRERADTGLKQIAILYRTNAQSRAFEEQLRRHNLPYQIFGGISFYQRKEIKDLMAYLKLIVNLKDDVSFERVINYPKRGIGQKTISDIATLAHRDNKSFYEVASRAGEYEELSSRAKRIEPFIKLIESFREKQQTTPIDLLAGDLVDELKLFEDFRSEDEVIGQTRIENVEAFIEGMAEFAKAHVDATLVDYLADISLFTDLDSYDDVEDELTMMTVHSAKGLEYDTVFVVGLEEGLFPLGNSLHDPMELEEERRLFYVGSTRARKRLYLSSATMRYRFGEVESMPSRFIKEIPGELLERYDFRTGRHYEYGTGQSQATLFPQRKKQTEQEGVHYDYEEDEIMRVGRMVQHPTFGRGKILKAEGFGDSLRLEIMFSGIGLKKIMARYAKLKVIG